MILHVITGLGAGGAESLLDTMVRTDTIEAMLQRYQEIWDAAS